MPPRRLVLDTLKGNLIPHFVLQPLLFYLLVYRIFDRFGLEIQGPLPSAFTFLKSVPFFLGFMDRFSDSDGSWRRYPLDNLPSLSPCRHIALWFIVNDFIFYWLHRLLHHPFLYKHIHLKVREKTKSKTRIIRTRSILPVQMSLLLPFLRPQHHRYSTPIGISA